MAISNLTIWQKKKRFNDLIQEHLDNLFRLACMKCQNRELAEDLVQDTCLKAFQSFLSKENIENPKAWLFRILINTHIDYTRKKQLNVTDIESYEFVDRKNDPSKDTENNLFFNDLNKALKEIDPEQREVVYLSDVQEYSYKEIAEMLDIPIGTVMSRLHRARQALRKVLSKAGYAKSSGAL